jgi:hypothetical protein
VSLVAIKGPINMKHVHEDPCVGDDVGATRLGDKLLGPIAHQGLYSSSIAAHQFGSVSVVRTKAWIGDGIHGDIEAVRTR